MKLIVFDFRANDFVYFIPELNHHVKRTMTIKKVIFFAFLGSVEQIGSSLKAFLYFFSLLFIQFRSVSDRSNVRHHI